ncbi:MAG: CehA/McbA family metallohydrolase [Chloroflexota bacterium]|nr:CehA/McbA family metallohydrolase [Chloroflexota bacterium]
MEINRWFKGNLHTHTTKSDGDAEPEWVAHWYKNHGYDFLVLSDHNHRTILEQEVDGLLMVPGEEVSASIEMGQIPIHINGVGVTRVVEPIHGDDIVTTIQANVDLIREAGGIVQINHPNFRWAFDHTHISQVTGAHLIEVHNSHPAVNNLGAPGRAGSEDIWDRVLSSGRVLFGTATDDSHNYHDWLPHLSNPGRGWVMVGAKDLSIDAIVSALATGEFYSSTGVILGSYSQDDTKIEIQIQEERDFIYTTVFSGNNGDVLAQVSGLDASYKINGNETYIRATITSSSGGKAWTQPVFV